MKLTQTEQTLRVLQNWGECVAFVIISANNIIIQVFMEKDYEL